MRNALQWLYAKKFYLIFASILLIFMGFLTIVWWLISAHVRQERFTIQCPDSNENMSDLTAGVTSPAPVNQAYIVVDIGGGVVNPGVYVVASSDKLADLVQKAGGLREEVLDMHLVQKQLNLAQSLSDGHKYYIPYRGETWTQTGTSTTPPSQADISSSNTTLISLNNADLKALQTLNGVGEVRAQQIIDNRPYTQLSDVVTKGALTQTVFDKNKDLLTL
ncbi:helix-hairpin-helix domain-containing protein [bacterium]|nr:helix-hairpin-helix domain-containing protein [bacterium]